MRILVLGGTAFLSRSIVEQAVARGHEVTSAARGSAEPPRGARFVRVDRDGDDGLAALEGEHFDAVVDVARRPSHVRGALQALAGDPTHWVFVSSISVYADTATPGQQAATAALLDPLPDDADEADPANYGPAKVRCEGLVEAAAGDRAFIVRAGLIGGPRDPNNRFGYWPLRLSHGGEVIAPGSPDDAVQYVDVDDLGAWAVTAAEERLVGTYDGIAPSLTRGEFVARVSAAVGGSSSVIWADQEFLVAQGVNPWMGPRSLPLWLPLPEYAGFMARDAGPARSAGLVIRDLADTARATLVWEREREATGSQPPAAGLSREEEAALLELLRRDDR